MLLVRHIGALLFTFAAQLSASTAQSSDWRDEEIGVPYVRNLISTNNEVLASTVRGLYRFDVTAGVWRFTTAETREFDLSFTNIQPGGVLTRESSSGVVRFVIAENVVERRPINYRVEANDSIVGVVTYAGTDPNVIRVDWKSWKTLVSYQLDTVVLPDRFFSSAVPCADGSLFYHSGGLVIFFKYGSSPRITRFPSGETYFDSEVYIHGAQTNIVMRSDENVVASSDLGVTWRNIRSGRSEAYAKIYPTNDPDIFYAVEDDRRIHVRLNGVRDDTLDTNAPSIENGAAGPFGWMINARSVIMHARPTSQNFIRADSGLPSAGVWDVHMLNGGIAALSRRGLTIRETASTWTFPLTKTYPDIYDVAGGTSIDDIWVAFFTGWEAGAYARATRGGELRDIRNVRLVDFRTAVYWDVGDSLFCFAQGDDIYLHQGGNNPWEVKRDANIVAIIVFFNHSVVGISKNGYSWRATQGLTDWRPSVIPEIQGNPVLTEPWTTVAGSRAIVKIGSDVLITSDYGKSWQLERLSKGEALTLGQSGIMYRGQYDALRGGYHFTATYDGVTTTIAVLPADQLDLDLAALDGICVNEEEGRLFAYAGSWIKSTTFSPISSVQYRSDQDELDLRAPVEIFDLTGRSVGGDLTYTNLPYGLDLVVQRGVTRCMVLPLTSL